MESTISSVDKEIAKTKEHHASIDNLPPIPAGPAVKNDEESAPSKGAASEAPSSEGVVDPAKVKVMVTE